MPEGRKLEKSLTKQSETFSSGCNTAVRNGIVGLVKSARLSALLAHYNLVKVRKALDRVEELMHEIAGATFCARLLCTLKPK